MSFLRRKIIRLGNAKAEAERPVYVGKIRANDYAQALRDPGVRETLARVIAKKKTTPSA